MDEDDLEPGDLYAAYDRARTQHPVLGPAEMVDLIRARLELPIRTEPYASAEDPVSEYVRAIEGDEATEED